MFRISLVVSLFAFVVTATVSAQAQSGVPGVLEAALKKENPAKLAQAAIEQGDPARGAVLFYQSYLACRKCHAVEADATPLGPNLAKLGEPVSAEHIVTSILDPSAKIRKGYETTTLLTEDGKSLTGRIVQESKKQLVLREASGEQKLIRVDVEQIDARRNSPNSLMPTGLTNQLSNRQQFLDLVRYVIEVSNGGPQRAMQLTPPPGSYATRPLPEYEKRVDHAGLLRDLDRKAFERGKAIYQRLCINCHGDQKRPGSLPTSLRFATGKFKSGADPFTMYQTLTRGFGVMQPQRWMVPQQKYDVIHYIREAYLKPLNSSQYVELSDAYLAALPAGDTRGPAPRKMDVWATMDYGPSLIHSYETGTDGSNIAYKGIAVRLDEGPGGVARGRYWMVYDADTLRLSAAWSGQGFIDWNGIMFNGRHNAHPHVDGKVHVSNPTGAGWSPNDHFDAPRVIGRDDKPYGPLPRDWAHYKGLYHHGQRTILSYTVGRTPILETPSVRAENGNPVFLRTLNIGARPKPITLQVATHPSKAATLLVKQLDSEHQFVTLGQGDAAATASTDAPVGSQTFDGKTHLTTPNGARFDMTRKDFTITARIRTKRGGSIFAKTAPQAEWVPNGKTLFVNNGRLAYDIGWVGQVQSSVKVNDGKLHEVALVWTHRDGQARLFVDGKAAGQRELRPKAPEPKQIVRIGYTAKNFPRPKSAFTGLLQDVCFYQHALSPEALKNGHDVEPVATFDLKDARQGELRTGPRKTIVARVASANADAPAANSNPGMLDVGVWPHVEGADWTAEAGSLRLTLPAGNEPLRLNVWMRSRADDGDEPTTAILGLAMPEQAEDLTRLTKGGRARWPETLKTKVLTQDNGGPFAVDVLPRPAENPWLARVRPTGLDFASDDRMFVCAWDGDVWQVDGLQNPSGELTWKRIASGLFQPLGLRIVDGKIFVTCRDQLCVLHDLNGDGETDFYENFNNDHQVTEHFHEFAMGLQTDAEGNFYYAKSARHALKAIVPHHGTLLKISKDGAKTEILATGFRAANGVCLNPDGTFIVTDQEGHWNPKNRINWVNKGGFYGNMFGYHDVTDSSDDAMDPPLCWITNGFDRSPSELLWVDSEKWGALNHSLLNFSYGYGKVYVVPHEEVDGVMQGGMCEFPLPRFPTGVMRGRFHKADQHLYACGMFAWAGNQQQPGGLYRLRATGKPAYLPTAIAAKEGRLEIKFSAPLDPKSVTKDRLAIKTWGLKRTASYGSKHYDEEQLPIDSVELSANGETVTIRSAQLEPTWCMEIRFQFMGADGAPANGAIHNTIHKLGK